MWAWRPSPRTPSTCATNARRRGWPRLRRPSRRAMTERSPSAPTVSRARMARRMPDASRTTAPETAPRSYVRSSTVVRSSSVAPDSRAAAASAASRCSRATERPVSRNARWPALANRPSSRAPRAPVTVSPSTGIPRGSSDASTPSRSSTRSASGLMNSEQGLSRGKAARSTTVTRIPARASSAAVALPAGPAPATSTSGDAPVLEAIEQHPVGIEAREGEREDTGVAGIESDRDLERAHVVSTIPLGGAREAFHRREGRDRPPAEAAGLESPADRRRDQVLLELGDLEALPFTDDRRSGFGRAAAPDDALGGVRDDAGTGVGRRRRRRVARRRAQHAAQQKTSHTPPPAIAATLVAAAFTPSFVNHGMPPRQTVGAPQRCRRHSLGRLQAGHSNRPWTEAPRIESSSRPATPIITPAGSSAAPPPATAPAIEVTAAPATAPTVPARLTPPLVPA